MCAEREIRFGHAFIRADGNTTFDPGRKLETASHKLAEAMYKASSQPSGGGPQGAPGGPSGDGAKGGEKPKDNVVDAEFVDVEDKK